MEHFLLRRPPRPLMSMTPSLLNARTTTKFLTTGWMILRSDVCRGDGLMNLIGQVIDCITDYGRPMKPFFIEIQSFWAWADKKEDKFWGFWHIFVKISAPMTSQLNFMVQWGANLDGTPELLYAEVMVHLESPKWAKLKLLMSQIVMKSLF